MSTPRSKMYGVLPRAHGAAVPRVAMAGSGQAAHANLPRSSSEDRSHATGPGTGAGDLG